MRGAAVEGLGEKGRGEAQQAGDGVLGLVGVGHVALAAMDDELAGERPAPTDLDHLAEALRVGGLTQKAMVESLAPPLRPFQELHRAVDGWPLLVAGDEEPDGAVERPSPPGDESERCREHAGDAALHVDRAAAVEHAVRYRAVERPVPPCFDGAWRDDVGMAREKEIGTACPDPRVEIVDIGRSRLREARAIDGETCLLQDATEPLQGTALLRRH